MFDDEREFSICEYCEDERGLCDRPHLVGGRRFSIMLDETFEVDARIPCHARISVLDKIGFSCMDSMEVKRVNLRTEHGYTFAVKLYNAESYSYFECKNWRALCKAYAFEPNMLITFDIRPEDEIEAYFHSSKHVRLLVDSTYYCPGAELNCEKISHYVSWLEDLDTVKTCYFPGLRNISTQYVRPLLCVLNYGHIYLGKMGLLMNVLPRGWMETEGQMRMISLRPRHPNLHMSEFRISKSQQVLIVKDWSKIVNDHRREVLGSSN